MRVQFLPDGEAIPFGEGVARAQFGRIDAQPAGELIHLRLIPEHHLHRPEPPHRARGRVVGERHPRVHGDVGHPVRPGRGDGRVHEDERAQVGVRARVGQEVDRLRHQAAVPRRPGAVPQVERVPLRAREQRLLARPHHPHRPPRLPRQEAEEGLDRDVFLPPESPADIRPDDADLVLGHAQHLGHAAKVLDDLRGYADHEHPVALDPGHPGLGLEVRVVDELAPVGRLNDHLGLAERLGGIAGAEAPGGQEVPPIVHLGGPRLERARRVEHSRQRLVLHRDRLGGPLGDLSGFGGDQRDRLALVPHHPIGQHLDPGPQGPHRAGLARDVGPQRVMRDVPRQHHRRHPREREGRGRVDAADPRRGIRRPQHGAVQHPGHLPVRGVQRAGLDFVPGVVTRDGPADDAQALLGRVQDRSSHASSGRRRWRWRR